MKYLWVVGVFFLMACQGPKAKFETTYDLLALVDNTNDRICSVPLADIREKYSAQELKEFTGGLENTTITTGAYASKVRFRLRRGALKRRLQVTGDPIELANRFYEELDDGIPEPTSLADHHNKMHYWGDRMNEQQGLDPDSDEYNMRFCVLNERRAKVFAGNRDYLLLGIENGLLTLDPEVIENINHEYIEAEDFKAYALSLIYKPELIAKLDPIDRARLRDSEPLLPTDSKNVEEFLAGLKVEADAYRKRISTHDYGTPAEKLFDMHTVDQMLRKLFTPLQKGDHFTAAEDIQASVMGVAELMSGIDQFNTGEIKTMLEGRGWFRDDQDGERAGGLAWLIVQHADRDPEFQQAALAMMEKELGAPGVSKSNYAYLYDRVQARFDDAKDPEDRMQRYGTQGRCVGKGKWEPLPLENPENIDALRAEMELEPLAEYKARFKDICVSAD